MNRGPRPSRPVAGALLGAAALVALTGCTGSGGSVAGGTADAAPGSAASSLTASASASASETAAASPTGASASCSVTSCSATLTNAAAQVSVLGKTISFGGVQNGRASLGVGDQTVSCAQGDKVSAGPLTLQCSTVTDSSVTLTASLG